MTRLSRIRSTAVLLALTFLSTSLLMVMAPTQASPSGEPLTTRSSSGDDAPVSFINVTDSVGLPSIRGDNFCWGDYDNDGDQDLLVTGNHLFRNNGAPQWDFTDVSGECGLDLDGYASWGDYDNDGWLDVYVGNDVNGSEDKLFHNRGDGTFSDVTWAAGGVTDPYPTLAVGWGDYDQDGYLDIYSLNWRDADNVKYPDTLWHNNGDGTFTDATRAAGVWEGDNPAAGMGFTWGDFNDDGWPDIYVGNYLLRANYLYENNRDGTFTDVAAEKGTDGHATWGGTGWYYGHSPGSAFGDMDNDGNVDLWVSNLAHRDLARALICDSSYFFHSNGPDNDYTFTDIFDNCGVPSYPPGGKEELYFGVAMTDWDNDGDLDMYIPQIKSNIDYAYSYMFRNNGDNTFTDVSNESGLRVWDTVGGAWCDYDQDGDMDLITEGKYPYEGPHILHLYQNQANANHWVQFDLRTAAGCTGAIDARLRLETSHGVRMMRDVESMMGNHCSQNMMIEHFGLGDDGGNVDVTIRWNSGKTQFLGDLGIDQVHVIHEPGSFPDLTVSELKPATTDISEGDRVGFSATVNNSGVVAATHYTVKLMEGGPNSGTLLDSFESTGELDPLASTHMDLTWDTTGFPGTHSIYCLVEGVVPPDPDPSNDMASIIIDVGYGPSPPGNHPPKITGLSADTIPVTPGSTATIYVTASDPDADELTYSFSSTAGSITSDGSTAYWIAPGSTGTYRISAVVKDVYGLSDSGTLDIEVGSANTPPVISDIIVSPEFVNAVDGQYVDIFVKVNDDDGDALAVSLDLSTMNRGTAEAMNDGSGADVSAGDDTYSYRLTVDSSTKVGLYPITVEVSDHRGSDTDTAYVNIHAPESTADGSNTFLADNWLFPIPIMVCIILAAAVVGKRRRY